MAVVTTRATQVARKTINRSRTAQISHSVSKRTRTRICASNDGSSSHFIAPFELERYFAKFEFTVPHLMCASDCESLQMSELLANADADCLDIWNNLSMSYTTSNGLQVRFLVTSGTAAEAPLPVSIGKELRDAICATQYSSVTADELLIAAPEELIFLTISTLLKAGDTCIVTFPGYQSLYEVARSRGVNVVFWEPRYTGGDESDSSQGAKKGRLKYDVEDLKELAAKTGSFEMLVINFPHNPTGACITTTELREVASVANAHDAWLFSDEMYRGLELNREDVPPSAADMHDVHAKTLVLGGMSKTYGCPGLRIGWLATHSARVLADISVAKDYTSICCCAPGEVLAAMALRRAAELEERNRQLILSNIAVADRVLGGFGDLIEWHTPEGGSMGFPRLRTPEKTVDEWSEDLVYGAGVLVLPASVFGHQRSVANNHFRIGLGRRDFPECMQAMEQHLLKASVPA